MLIEIRRYTLKPGVRDEFVAWFEREVLPAMEDAGMRILAVFVGEEDPRSFFYLRGLETEEERQRQTDVFYQSDVWLGAMRDKALAMEESSRVELVRSTPASRI